MTKPSPRAASAILALSILTLPDGAFAQKIQVFVTASLVDKSDLFIENLEKQEIQILENNQPRQLEFIARDEILAVYGLIFDRALLPEHEENARWGSGQSISDASFARNIAYELIDKYLGRQTLWVGVYERELEVALDFVPDGFRAKEAIQRISGRRATEEPFLYAALYSSVMRMKDRNERRRVLIFFVDLLDARTVDKLKPLKNLLSYSNVEVFFVSFASKLGGVRPGLNPAMSQAGLKELSQMTAGDAFFAADYREHPEDITRRMYNQLRTYYTFGFESEAPPDKSAKLTIRCTRPGSRVKCHPTVPILR